MSTKLVVGLDGHSSGERALAHAKKLAGQIGSCEILVAYIVEWSPFSFQTAMERVVDPAIKQLADAGMSARGIVKHGDVAETLNRISVEEGADQIIVARSSEGGISNRIFGSSTSNLVMSASVPVTVVN
jgi:nucleotide-binding universal stress UspA family protein